MAVRKVVRLPDPVLITPALHVGEIGEEAKTLAEDLLDTMAASPACVGLAANQIGVGLKAFAVDVTGHPKANSCHGPFVLFDPVLLSSEEPELAREGCMSVPDLTGDVSRATKVKVAGVGPTGEKKIMEVDAFEARAVLHELDHLEGMVFLDRVSGPRAVFARKVYR